MFPIESEFVEANGLRFHVETCGDRTSSRDSRFAYMGFRNSATPGAISFRYLRTRLSGRGHPTLRGYGKSERPSSHERLRDRNPDGGCRCS